jgi:hypothetical protein
MAGIGIYSCFIYIDAGHEEKTMKVAALAMIIGVSAVLGFGVATADVTNIAVKAPLQPWQARRAQLDQTLHSAANGDAAGLKQFQDVLVDFEKKPFDRTPIENLEIFGAYYLPREGTEVILPYIVTNLVLGWYDTLRFASSSGKAEIIDNEQFFKKAFVIVNPEVTAKITTYLQGHPEQVAKLVTEGLGFADNNREVQSYDRHWPSAYGMERLTCAMGGECKAPLAMPKDQWDAAWVEAKKQVSQYFNVKPPAAAAR